MKSKILTTLALVLCVLFFMNCSPELKPKTEALTGAQCSSSELTALESSMTSSLTVQASTSDVPFSLIVQSADYRQFMFEAAGSSINTSYESASTSKFITATIILSLVDRGYLTLASKPTDYAAISSYWTTSAANPISKITLRDLLSFTSGLQNEPNCLILGSGGNVDLAQCVHNVYDSNVNNMITPGSGFYYSSNHLQVAGLMAMQARGLSTWGEVFNDFISYQQSAHGVVLFPTSVYDLPNTSNPRLAGGMHWTGAEYLAFLKAFYEKKLLSPALMNQVVQDHNDGAAIVNSPVLKSSLGEDWHYGFGFWLECKSPAYNCAGVSRISSPGAYGGYPFVDYTNNYYGIVARQGAIGTYQNGVETFRAIESDLKMWATKNCQ